MNSLDASRGTHLFFIRANRGPPVNFETDCIDGGYPTGLTPEEVRLLDWKMNRQVHHRYYEVSSFHDLQQLNISVSFTEDFNSLSGKDLIESYFKEFSVKKSVNQHLGKVAQQPRLFPFTDIHGWTESQRNTKKISMLNRVKNKKYDKNVCQLWHFNPKWDSWFRGICKRISKYIEVPREDFLPKFLL